MTKEVQTLMSKQRAALPESARDEYRAHNYNTKHLYTTRAALPEDARDEKGADNHNTKHLYTTTEFLQD